MTAPENLPHSAPMLLYWTLNSPTESWVGMTIQILCALICERTANLIVAPAKRVLPDGSSTCAALGYHGRSSGKQVENVASVQRKLIGLARVNHLAQRGGFGLEQRRLRCNFDDLTDFANLQRRIHGRGLLHLDSDVSAREVLKTCFFDINPVVARVQIHKRVEAVRAALRCAFFLRPDIRQGHSCIGNRSSG